MAHRHGLGQEARPLVLASARERRLAPLCGNPVANRRQIHVAGWVERFRSGPPNLVSHRTKNTASLLPFLPRQPQRQRHRLIFLRRNLRSRSRRRRCHKNLSRSRSRRRRFFNWIFRRGARTHTSPRCHNLRRFFVQWTVVVQGDRSKHVSHILSRHVSRLKQCCAEPTIH